MTDPVAPAAEDGQASPLRAGPMLTQAREAAGLSVEAVAQQLKLAPRQIRALETGDYKALPGRTFVRGFVRNYARLLRIDPDVAIAALPDEIAAPSLERPTLTPTSRVMGEIPAEDRRRPGIARWAIPLALIAIVAAAVYYEIGRPPQDARRVDATTVQPASAPAPAPAAAPAPAPAAEPASTGTALPNPLANAASENPSAATTVPGMPPPDPLAGGAPSTDAPAGEVTLEFAFRGRSWVEVRDAKGAVIMATTGTRGATQSVTTAPPIDVTIGSGNEVDVTWGGKRIDLTPHIKQNVARVRLPLGAPPARP